MYYFDLYTTQECNLKCRYCVQDKSSRQKAHYDLHQLKRYISSFEGEKCIVFYGGEPLLNIEFIVETMHFFRFDDIKFGVQTNGILLDRIPQEELSLFDMIMVSIDGCEVSHNKARGCGNYHIVLNNVNNIKNNINIRNAINLKNDKETGLVRKRTKVYARLTVSDAIEYIDYSIVGLMNGFEGIYWQTCDTDYDLDAYIRFSESYNKQVQQLIDFWYSNLKEGIVISFPSFNLVYRDLALKIKHEKVRCGANSTHFTIDVHGNVFPCVDSVFDQKYKIGHISECDSSRHHSDSISCSVCKRCAGCMVGDICGGACWMDVNNADIGREYSYVKCSNIISLIKHVESYVNSDKGKYVSLINDNIQENKLFYDYCEEMP